MKSSRIAAAIAAALSLTGCKGWQYSGTLSYNDWSISGTVTPPPSGKQPVGPRPAKVRPQK